MSKIIKIALVALLGLFGLQANAQNGLSVKAGLSINNGSVSYEGNSYEDYSYNVNSKVGFHLGVGYEIPFNERFSFETGLILDSRGYNLGYEEEKGYGYTYKVVDVNASVSIYSFTIPALAKGRIEVGNDINLFANVGPYANIILSGKQTVGNVSETIKFDDKEQLFFKKRFNLGLHIGAGVEYKNYVAGLGYDLGLTNLADRDNVKSKLHTFKISVGYKF